MGNEVGKCCEPEKGFNSNEGNPDYPPPHPKPVQGTAVLDGDALPVHRGAASVPRNCEQKLGLPPPLLQALLLEGEDHEYSMLCPDPRPMNFNGTSPSADSRDRRSWLSQQQHGGGKDSSGMRSAGLAGSQLHDNGGGFARTRSAPTTFVNSPASTNNVAGRPQPSSFSDGCGYESSSQEMKGKSCESQFFLMNDWKEPIRNAESHGFGRTSSAFSRTSSTGTVIRGRMVVEADQSHQTRNAL